MFITARSAGIMSECYSCKYRRGVPGDCHSQCVNPDPAMTGDPHGIQHGWFFYPLLFDPVWKTKACANYQEVGK